MGTETADTVETSKWFVLSCSAALIALSWMFALQLGAAADPLPGQVAVSGDTQRWPVVVGAPRTETFTVTNSGGVDILFETATITSDATGAFSVDATDCLGDTLTALSGSSCALAVTVNPTDLGDFTRDANLHVVADATASDTTLKIWVAGKAGGVGAVSWGENNNHQSDCIRYLPDTITAMSTSNQSTGGVTTDNTFVGCGGPWANAWPSDHDIALTAGGGTAVVRLDGTVSTALGFGGPIPAELTDSRTAHVVAISGGAFHYLALKSDGSIRGWGDTSGFPNYGQLNIPAELLDSRTAHVASVAADNGVSAALRADGTVVSWGRALGAPARESDSTTAHVVQVSVGRNHVLALHQDGTVATWGDDCIETCSAFVASLRNVVKIAAGYPGNLALLANGSLVSWDNNGNRLPTPIGLTNVTQIMAGVFDYPGYANHFIVVRGYAPAKYTPSITTPPTASGILLGQALASSTLSGGAAEYNGVTVPGSFAWETSTTTPAAGVTQQSVTFTPDNQSQFSSVTFAVSLTTDVPWAVPDGDRIAASPTKVYVTSPHGIYVLDATTGRVTDTWTAFSNMTDIAISPDSNTVYVTRKAAYVSQLVGINVANPSDSATWQAPSCDPVGVDLRGTTAYLACSNQRWVATQDLTQPSGSGFVRFTANEPNGDRGFRSIAVSPDGKRIYVAANYGFLVYTETGSVVTYTQRGQSQAFNMFFGQGLAWMVNLDSANQLSAVDTSNDDWKPRGKLHLAGSTYALSDAVFAPDASFIYAIVDGVVQRVSVATVTGVDPFGLRRLGSPETRTATFHNFGATSVNVSSVSASSQSWSFSTRNDACTGQSIPAGGTCTVDVVFSPNWTTNGTEELIGTLSFVPSTGPVDAVQLELRGRGIRQPNIEMFLEGNPWPATVGETYTQVVTVKNTGEYAADLKIESATIVNDATGVFSIMANTCDGATLRNINQSQDSCTVTVGVHPTSFGTYDRTAKLRITSDANPAAFPNGYRDATLNAQVVGTNGALGLAAWAMDNAGQAACVRDWPDTVTSISLGAESSAGITAANTFIGCGIGAWMWNGTGNLAQITGGGLAVLYLDGTVAVRGDLLGTALNHVPAELTDSTTAHVTAVSSIGGHFVALRADGTVQAWGVDGWDGHQTQIPAELTDPETAHVTAVAAGIAMTVALRADGTALTWGSGMTTPAEYLDSTTAHLVKVTASWSHVLALKADGTIAVWGTCTAACKSVAESLRNVVDVEAGSNNLALLADGSLVSWNAGGYLMPTPIGLSGIKQIGAATRGEYGHNAVLRGAPVKPKPGVLSAPRATSLTRGETLANAALSGGQAFYGGVQVPGSFTWLDATIAPATGTARQTALFTPNDTATFQSVRVQVPVTVTEPWAVDGGVAVVKSPDGSLLYVASPSGIYVMRTSNGGLVDLWTSVTTAGDLALDATGTHLYASVSGSSQLVEISISSGDVTNTWDLPGCNPNGVDVRAGFAYLSCATHRWVGKQDLTQASGSGFTAFTANYPDYNHAFRGLSWNPTGTRLYVVADYGTIVYNAAGETVTVTIRGSDQQPYEMLFSQGYNWLVNRAVGTIGAWDTGTAANAENWQSRGSLRFAAGGDALQDAAFANDGVTIYALVSGRIDTVSASTITGVNDLGRPVQYFDETHTATFHNLTAQAVTFETLTIANNPYDAIWQLRNDTCSHATVAAGGSCTVDVWHNADWNGESGSYVVFPTTGLGGSSIELSLFGHYIRPGLIELSGEYLGPDYLTSIGFAALGDSSTATLTARNAGELDLHIDTVTVINDATHLFSVPANHCAGATLAAGETCTVDVRFTPSALTDVYSTAQISFTSDTGYHPGTPYGINVWGRVVGTASNGPGVYSWGKIDPYLQTCAVTMTGLRNVSAAWRATGGLTQGGSAAACDLWAGVWDTYTDVVATAGGGIAILRADGTVVVAPGAVAVWPALAAPAVLTDSSTAHVVQLSCGEDHCAAVRADGTAIAWGNNYYGGGQDQMSPELLDPATAHLAKVAVSGMPALGLRQDGTVVTWGNAMTWYGMVPALLTDSQTAHVIDIAAGVDHALALQDSGTVVAWGGGCDYNCRAFAAALRNVVAIAAGHNQSLALLADGSLVSWDKYGKPLQVPVGLKNITQIAAGPYHFVALAPWPERFTPTTFTAPTASTIIVTQTLAASTLSGGVMKANGTTVEGTFTWLTPTTAPAVGTDSQTAVFTPTNGRLYDTVTVQVPVTVAKATTSVTYTGGQIVIAGTALKVTASATSTFACGSPSFVVTPSPLSGTGSLTLTPGGNGSVDTTGWLEGAYTLTVTYGGGDACQLSTDEATITVVQPGAAASGGGAYTVAGAGRVNTAFTVRAISGTRPVQYKGQLLWINNGKWRLKATISTYGKSGGTGYAGGTGTLQWWNQSLNGGLGMWVVAQYNVSYTVSFTATTKTSKGSFAIKVNYTPTDTQPNGIALNRNAIELKGGSISLD